MLLIVTKAERAVFLRRIFDSLEIELTTASAVRRVEASPKTTPDLFIMDVRMGGGMNGLETCAAFAQPMPSTRHHDDA